MNNSAVTDRRVQAEVSQAASSTMSQMLFPHAQLDINILFIVGGT